MVPGVQSRRTLARPLQPDSHPRALRAGRLPPVLRGDCRALPAQASAPTVLSPAAPASSPTLLPVDPPDPLRTDLAAANAARHDWIAQEGRQRREVHGYYRRPADFRISTTDPDATPMRLKG